MLMPVLPHDVIYEILVWLPVKSLLRFRCVCKSWYEIIDRRDFIFSHLHTSSINKLHRKLIVPWPVPCYGCWPYNGNLKLFRALDIDNGFQEELLHNFKMSYRMRLMHTANCNGLVLFHEEYFIFSVWNPSIRRYRVLPYPSGMFRQPYGQNYSFGFGYDPTIDDYKVVLIIPAEPYNEVWNVWILELKSSCWRRIQDLSCIEFHDIGKIIDGNCFTDGCLHFLCFGNDWKLYTIVSFDLVEETFTFSTVSHPTYQGQEYARRLQAFEGCLSIYFYTVKNIDFFVRKKEGDEFTWTKLFSLAREVLMNLNDLRTLGYSKERDKILFMTGRQMYSYDFKEAHLQPIEITKSDGTSESMFYTESLVSVYEKMTVEEFEEEKSSMQKFEEWKRKIAEYEKANQRGSSKKSKKKKKKRHKKRIYN